MDNTPHYGLYKPSPTDRVSINVLNANADIIDHALYTLETAEPSDIHWASIVDAPSSMPASDVYQWAKERDKPIYGYEEITDAPQAETSNIDFQNEF